MTGDEYMDVLLERQAEYELDHPAVRPWLRPLLEWFVRPGDEKLVDLPAPVVSAPAAKPPTRPRTYRTVESLRAERDRLQARADALVGSAGVPDRAASHGEAMGRSGTRRQSASDDRKLAQYVEVAKRINTLDYRIARAEAREARS